MKKILFDKCLLEGFLTDSDIKLGIGWYKHHKNHKWKGFTVSIYCFKWALFFTYVSNFEEYNKRMNYRWTKK